MLPLLILRCCLHLRKPVKGAGIAGAASCDFKMLSAPLITFNVSVVRVDGVALLAFKGGYLMMCAREINFGHACPIFGLDPPDPPPTPYPPLPLPHPDKMVTKLLLFQIGIHLHTHQDLKLKCCRVMGQKPRYGRPCTRDLRGTHNWLSQSHNTSISSEFH